MQRSKSGGRLAASVASCFLLLSVCFQGASANDDQRYQSVLDAMLADIGDPQKSFEFVQAATEVGDLRGAVAALERMLLINPGLANIQLELGVLYLRLGNADLGQYHINRALRAPNVPRVVRERAESLLASSGGRGGSNFFHGQISLVGQYESNANAAPSSPEVLVLSLPGELSSDSLEQSDSSESLALSLTHTYAFAGDGGHSFESNLLAYTSQYNQFDNLNLAVGSLDIGPAFRIAGSADSPIVVRPYASGTYDLLDGDHYLTAFGGGLELRMQSSVKTYSFVRLEYSDQEFQDSPNRIVSDRSGESLSATIGLTHQFGRSLQMSATVSADQTDALALYQTYTRFGGGLSAKVYFGYGGARPPWSIGLSANMRKVSYDAVDPQVSVFIVREDSRYDGSLTADIPLSRSLLLSIKGLYTSNDSNISNYAFDSASGSLGLSWRF